VADHPRPAADVALGDVCGRVGKRGLDVLGGDALRADVVEEAVERLADDGQRPRVGIRGTRGDRVAYDADAERVRDADRRRQQA
jgi:hypothetical protein